MYFMNVVMHSSKLSNKLQPESVEYWHFCGTCHKWNTKGVYKNFKQCRLRSCLNHPWYFFEKNQICRKTDVNQTNLEIIVDRRG